MNVKKYLAAGIMTLLFGVMSFALAQNQTSGESNSQIIATNAQQMLEDGRKTFRFDTFGSESFWGDTLKLHQAIAGAQNGGVGVGVSPKTALSVGLKVDVDALPKELIEALKAGKVNLDDPATTLALLKLNSVVGVTGFFDGGKNAVVETECAKWHKGAEYRADFPGRTRYFSQGTLSGSILLGLSSAVTFPQSGRKTSSRRCMPLWAS